MAASGISASFIFGGITFGVGDCIQTTGIQTSANAPTYQCSGILKNAIGAKAFSFSYSIAVGVSEDSKVTALDLNSTSAFTFYPFGNTATYLKLTSTRGQVTGQNVSAPSNGVVTVDGTIVLDDLTIGAAT